MYNCNFWLKFVHYAVTKSLQSPDFFPEKSLQQYHDKSNIVQKKDAFHQERRLNFKELTAKVQHLEHSCLRVRIVGK